MADSDMKTLEAKCFCGAIHFTIDVPKEKLPLPVYLCQCSLCRFSTGNPCVLHTALPEEIKPQFIAPSKESNLTTYSIEGASCTYDFCSTCGCHIAGVAIGRVSWTPSTSIFTDHSPENFLFKSRCFTKSAKDGGVAQFLPEVDGRAISEWNPPDDDPSAKIVEAEPEVGADGKDRLRVKCHCGGISFTIKRPSEEDVKDKVIGKYVSGPDNNKWLASFDVCNNCRLVTGNHVIGWTFFPLSSCEPHIGPDLMIGTSKTFSASKGVVRTFCGDCGATIFFSAEDRRASKENPIVDLAVGVVRAPEGYMAEDWLGWRPNMAFVESGRGYDKGFVDCLEKNFGEWAEARQSKS